MGTALLLVIASFLTFALVPSSVDIKKDSSFAKTVSIMADELAGVVRENIRTGYIASNIFYSDGSVLLYDGIIARQTEKIVDGFPVLVWTFHFPNGGLYDVNGTYQRDFYDSSSEITEKWRFYEDGTGYYETFDDEGTFYTDEILPSWTSRGDAPSVPPVPVIIMSQMSGPEDAFYLPRTTYTMLYDVPFFSDMSAEYHLFDGIITIAINTAGRPVENEALYGLEKIMDGLYVKEFKIR